MRTRLISLAAYLHLSGLEPTRVEWDHEIAKRIFVYDESPMLSSLLQAWDRGAMVPAKEFDRARVDMKRAQTEYQKARRPVRRTA